MEKSSIERGVDGGWYRDGQRVIFARNPIFWEGHRANAVLRLASDILCDSRRLGWALVVYGTSVTDLKSLSLDDEQRPASLNPHPAAIERTGSQWYRAEFTTGDVAVIQVAKSGYWGSEDADVETTVSIASGTAPQPTEAEIDAHRMSVIVLTAEDAARATLGHANGTPVLSIPGYGTIVEWQPHGYLSCYKTEAVASDEVRRLLRARFEELRQTRTENE